MSEQNAAQTQIVDDEMPLAPAAEGSTDVPANNFEIDGTMSSDIVAQGLDLGEPLPKGIYHAKLASYENGGTATTDGMGINPYFKCKFEVMSGPHTGRVFYDLITWVRAHDFKMASMGDADGLKACKNRLGKMKNFQEAGGFKPVGSYNVRTEFLDRHPEIKASLGQKQRMEKDDDGKYSKKVDGKFDNVVEKYFPVQPRQS